MREEARKSWLLEGSTTVAGPSNPAWASTGGAAGWAGRVAASVFTNRSVFK